MAKKKNSKDKKQPWSIPLRAREELYNGINPSAGFGIGSFLTQGAGYLGGFRTGQGMNEDEARWAAYLGLPYDKEYAPDTKIRFEHDKNYPDRQYQGVSKRAKNEIREEVIPEAKRIKDEYGKEWIQVLDERGIFGNDSTIYHPRETYTGDLGKFGIREVGNSGIYEIGDKYDFPSWVPVPDRNKGTELMIRDTIWSDRADPKLYKKEIIKRKKKFYDGGLKVDMPNFKGTQLTSNISNKTPLSFGQSFKVGAANAWNNVKTGQANGAVNSAATAVGELLAGGKESGVGTALQGLGSLASNIPGVGGLIGAGVNLVGGLVNAAFGSKLNKEEIAKVKGQIGNLKSFTSDASDYDSLASNYTSMPVIDYFSKDDIGSDGWFSDKAEDKWEELKKEKEQAEQWVQNSLFNNAQNIATNKQQLLEANYTAYGGKLNKFDNGGFANFINSDAFNGIGDSLMGFSYTTGGEDQYIQNSLGRNHGSGYYGVASKAGMATYDIINGIRNLTKSKRTPIQNKIGLYANGGNISKYAGLVESGAKLIGNAINEANNMVDIKPIQSQVRQFGNTSFGGTNDDLMNQWGNTSFLSPNVTTRDIRNKSYFDDFMTSVPASFEGFNAGSSFGPIGAAAGAIIGGASSLVGSFIGRNKAEKRAKRLNESITKSNERVRNSFNLAVQNNNKDTLFNMMKNYSAYGGPISGALDYEYYNNITNNDKLDILGSMKFTSLPNSFSNVEMQELNTFDEGGPKNSIPTQEEYIAQQIAAKRAAALDKSRNRTEPVLPIINGVPNRNSCIYTATDNYGKKYRVPGNWTFYENPEKYGFLPIDINDAQAGDIIQVLDKGTPYHAMILDGYDEQGRPLYNYSRGSSGDSSDIVKSSTNFPNTEKLAYTFTGTPADSTQWINEYKEMYNKKEDGGPLEGENSSTNNKAKNKRTYIGGTKSETRKKYFNLDKELTQVVTNLATSYGISPALVIDRLAHEGIIDRLINDHNFHVLHGNKEKPYSVFSDNIFNSPYSFFGLDYIFDTYTKGTTKTKRPINFRRMPIHNESGERVNSGDTNNIYDTLELFTAELASRREQVKKQYPNLTDAELDSATAARYNASNKYFKQLMDSGEYKTEYPIDVEGVNIPTPTKTDSKYIQDQVQSINKSTVLRDFKDYHYHGNDRSYLIDGSVFTVGNKSYNPGLFIDEGNHEFKSDSPLVDRFIDNYVNRNYTIPSKVKVVDDYYENKKANGGNLFTNGVTQINNGGTHEYLEGQEYDVTEEEIKLLKKLGYEFEYL